VTSQRKNTSGTVRRQPARRPGPEGGKRQLNRRRRQRQLAAAALELFLEQGIEAVSIDEVVGRAGSAKGSFYRYFEDKRHAVEVVLEPVRERIISALERCDQATADARGPDDLAEAYRGLAVAIVTTIAGYPDQVRLYLQECHGPARGARAPVRELADQITDRAERLTRMAIEHRMLRPIDARVSALAVIGAAERLTFDHLCRPDAADVRRVAESLVQMVLEGIQGRPTERR
jgi:AcrR family transcriptional regulator